MPVGSFVWTKMGAEGGQTLPKVIALKEAERRAGKGIFWWGVGNSLGLAAREAAIKSGGTLPVIFSAMLTRHKRADSHPDHVCLWEYWQDIYGNVQHVPPHVLEWSRGDEAKQFHYALICESQKPLMIGDEGRFDPLQCKTAKGKSPGASQVTALLDADLDADHSRGDYHCSFRATLVEPWFVKLIKPRILSVDERGLHNSWKHDGDWEGFVNKFRGGVAV